MKGPGQKLNRNQEKAITALLIHTTLSEAAKFCGISEATLWRWMQIPSFQEAYAQARRSALEGAIGQLQQAAGLAVATLIGIMQNPLIYPGANQIAAARTVLEYGFKGADLLDMEKRIAALEELMQQQEQEEKRRG